MHLSHPDTWRFIADAVQRAHDAAIYTRAQKRAILRLASILARPLTIGIAGEGGTGKSTLLNALLGSAIIPAGGLGRLRPVFHARYGREHAAFAIRADGSRNRLTTKGFEQASAGRAAFPEDRSKVIYKAGEPRGAQPAINSGAEVAVLEVQSPVQALREVEFLELPAGHALMRHFKLGRLKKLDIALWATPAYQAWKRSESLAWQDLGLAPRQRSILVATQKDSIAGVQDRERLLARIERDTAPLFRACVLVSAKDAFKPSSQPADPVSLSDSGMPQLERAIEELVVSIRQARLGQASSILERIEHEPARLESAISAPAVKVPPPSVPGHPAGDLSSFG